ncbi:VPLPA-CTERM sorting domain-containing protein [Algihabitans albus]|uniref:VPLPA-CTERM sorting domain-containing protein n=1 Tax=Algihabitans albus TaxID=2164067 RepID=UPI0013C2C848|nr:VPLPA-CTERM sorting domain-containing protein [Algihabitans albus]
MESLKVWGAAGVMALAAATLTPHDAHAALLADGGTAGPVATGGATNDLIDDNTVGVFGAQIYITDRSRPLTFTFRGLEAGFRNAFGLDLDGDGDYFNDPSTVLFSEVVAPNNDTGLINGASITVDFSSIPLAFDAGVGGYLLPFAFATWKTVGGPGDPIDGGDLAENGSNVTNADGSPVNFFSSFGPSNTWGDAGPTGNRLVLLFDDNGAGDDDNHDDFAVEIAVTPLPAAAWFLITALSGLFGMRWLRGRNEA